MNHTTAPSGLLRRLIGSRGDRQRGYAEVGVAATGAALVLGAALGSGVASTVVTMSDGVTWLPDEETGQVVQINPATGRAERRLQVAGEGSELAISQADGRLVVTDLGTGTATAIDLATLLASGQRRTEEAARVLVGGGQVYLVTVGTGVVRAVDPLTLKDLGSPYRAGSALADAVVDAQGAVWVVTAEGDVRSVTWKPGATRFTVSEPRPVRGAGRGTRLLPHARGVTVFAPDGGAIVQVGVGRDLAVAVPALSGEVLPAAQAPTDLAPAGVPARSAVVMLSGDRLLEVGVGTLGCARPGRPAVFTGLVYVPCTGSGRVLVLAPDGSRARPDVVVPAGTDPRLLVDDGRLVVHTEDGSRAVVVEADGATRVVDTGRGGAAVHDPRNAASAPVAAPAQRPAPQRGGAPGGPRQSGHQQPRQDEPRHEEQRPAAPAGEQPAPDRQPAPDQPSAPGPEGGPATPPGTGPTAAPTRRPTLPAVTRPPAGTGGPASTTRPTMSAGGRSPVAPTSTAGPTATPGAAPDAPTRVEATVGELGTTGRRVLVEWTGVTPRPDAYAVHAVVLDVTGDVDADLEMPPSSVEVPGTASSATLEVTCLARYRFTVEAVVDGVRSEPGIGPAVSVPACERQQAAQAPTNVTATPNADGTVTVTWTGSTSDVDGYLVGPVGGSTTETGPRATSVVLRDVPPGEGVSFVVTAFVEPGLRAASQPSAPVTVVGAPGEVRFAGGMRMGWAGTTYSFGIGWDVPVDNGSPVQSYDVVWRGGDQGGELVTTEPSFAVDLSCGGRSSCVNGGVLTLTVTPRNAVGPGPAATFEHRFAARGPAEGETVVLAVEPVTPELTEPTIEMVAVIEAPPAWAAHTNGCTLVTTWQGFDRTRPVACTGGTVSVGTGSSGSRVTVAVRADGLDGGSVTSAPVTAVVPDRSTWPYCDPTRTACTPSTAGAQPDVTEIPDILVGIPDLNPGRGAVAGAGTFLLLGAGGLRALRRRAAPDRVHVLSPTEERPG